MLQPGYRFRLNLGKKHDEDIPRLSTSPLDVPVDMSIQKEGGTSARRHRYIIPARRRAGRLPGAVRPPLRAGQTGQPGKGGPTGPTWRLDRPTDATSVFRHFSFRAVKFVIPEKVEPCFRTPCVQERRSRAVRPPPEEGAVRPAH